MIKQVELPKVIYHKEKYGLKQIEVILPNGKNGYFTSVDKMLEYLKENYYSSYIPVLCPLD